MEFLLVPFIVFFGLGVYSLFKPGKHSGGSFTRTKTEDEVENLHRLYSYSFWRDFGKQRE
jgi:hypothetical protein